MELKASDFTVTALRLVVFTPNHAEFKQSAVIAAVLGQFAKHYDAEVQAMPLPPGAPPDIPRCQLASIDGRWRFAAAPARVSSTWDRKGDDDVDSTVALIGTCNDPIMVHVRENHANVGRVGWVITRVCWQEHPSQTLIDRFCRDEVKDPSSPDSPLRNSDNFEIHNHKRYRLPTDLTVNSWVRCRSGMVGEPARPAVTVEQDINTLGEEINELSFDAEQIGSFFLTCLSEADAILQKYFPT